MATALVVTVIGDDRPGIVRDLEALANELMVDIDLANELMDDIDLGDDAQADARFRA